MLSTCPRLHFDNQQLICFHRRVLKSDTQNKTQLNVLQEKQLVERRTALRKKIIRYARLLPSHLPLYTHRFPSPINTETPNPEDLPLIFASTLPADIRLSTCPAPFTNIEERLREAQAYEALGDVRRYLRQRNFASTFKIKNVTGQRANTRARQWLNTINAKVVAAKHTYRHARACLLNLRGPGDWEKVLRVLDDSDVRGLNECALTEAEKAEREAIRERGGLVDEVDGMAVAHSVSIGEGRRTLSWIWSAPGSVGQGDSETVKGVFVHFSRPWCFELIGKEDLHIEWLKARARALRYLENIRLLYEEMRRAVVTTKWIAGQWESRATARKDVSAELGDGLSAYAREQADAEYVLAEHWSLKWLAVQGVAEQCLTQSGGLDIRMGESYFSNDDDDDVDDDDPNTTRQPEPITVEITLDTETRDDDE